jgi:hypothetical protein
MFVDGFVCYVFFFFFSTRFAVQLASAAGSYVARSRPMLQQKRPLQPSPPISTSTANSTPNKPTNPPNQPQQTASNHTPINVG